jgi:hypothetical protein
MGNFDKQEYMREYMREYRRSHGAAGKPRRTARERLQDPEELGRLRNWLREPENVSGIRALKAPIGRLRPEPGSWWKPDENTLPELRTWYEHNLHMIELVRCVEDLRLASSVPA